MKEVFLRRLWLEDLEGGDLDRGIAITHFPALVGRSSDCDYQINQPFISRRHCSFDLHVAHDGPAAVQAARAHQPDTVFLDILLAGANGVQVAQQLRNEAGLDKAILVGITGYDPADTLERSQESGFQCLLTKPVAAEALQEVLSHPE